MTHLDDEFEVVIAHGGGECPRFEVTWHVFGKIPEGDAHNELVMERRQFIEDALREKLGRTGRP
jgi:hypothetical protein